MRTNKIFILLLLAMISLTACSDDDDAGGNYPFTVTRSELTFTNNGGSTRFSVRSEGTPVITCTESWVKVEPYSTGNHIYNYTVTADAYVPDAANQAGYDDRMATINVECTDGTSAISVVQTPEYGLFVTSEREISVGVDGGEVSIETRANGEYTVTADADWLTVNGTTTRAMLTDYATSITVGATPSQNTRSAKVSFTLGDITESVTITQAPAQFPADMDRSAMDIAKAMYPGWNLGNTLEAANGEWLYTNNGGLTAETAWQSTYTTQQVIDFVKAQGFRSVRIPCNWMNGHIIDADDYTIDSEWMNRVNEIVDYCIADGLYVVLNDHYDGGWLQDSFDNIDDETIAANSEKLKKVWTQIAGHFKDYNEYLVFAGLNEPAVSSQAQTDALLKYEQAFIDAVRATGGNNAKRVLIVQGPNTNIGNTYDWFDVTRLDDTAEDALMVEVHYYDPSLFTGVWDNGTQYYFWGEGNLVSGSPYSVPVDDYSYTEDYMLTQFQKMKAKFFDNGYPVLLGEFGTNWRSIGDNQDKHDASVRLYHKLAVKNAIDNGMVPMVWDINVPDQNGTAGIMTIINRADCSLFGSPAMEGINEGLALGQWPQ